MIVNTNHFNKINYEENCGISSYSLSAYAGAKFRLGSESKH